MPIIELQRRLSEIGRIRLGQQVENSRGKKRPAALTTFRLTSADKSRIEEAAQHYGGKVTQWDAPSGIKQWECVTEAEKLPVVVPPSAMAFSQNFELWSGGGCKRRCDGVTETLSEQACLCDPENRDCDIHTRLSVLLRDLNGLGVWRVDTSGYYAAVELQGAVDVISLAAGKGQMLPATLRLDQRVIKRDGETKRFVVPVLDIEVSPAQLLMGTVGITGGAPVPVRIEEPQQRSLTPVPDGGPAPSIADQVAQSENQPSRRRASTQEIPRTGLAPRTAAQAANAGGGSKPASRLTDDFAPPPRQVEDEPPVLEGNPRMCSAPQLTKLGILLNNMGFDKTDEGRAARLSFCQSAIKQLLPDSPHSERTISSSKELTFAEANALINMLESDERKEREAEERRVRDNAIEESADPPSEESSATDSTEVSESVEDAAERIRLARGSTAVPSEGVDPEADSPHGPGCEPNCTLTEDEHPPYVPTDSVSEDPDSSKVDAVADSAPDVGESDQKDDSQLSLG